MHRMVSLFLNRKIGKKGAFAPIMTVAYVMFCLLYYVIFVAFSMDPIHTEGSIGSIDASSDISINESEDSTYVSYTDRNWISKFFITVFNMPWWLNVFIGTLQVVILGVLTLAWVRGL